MAGHSKWKQIKDKKAKSDAQKSKMFGKLGRFLSSEIKKAKGDVNAPNVRAAIEKARSENMPNDTIERAIKKGTSDGAAQMDTLVYESYGPGGVALIIVALTDNRNKAAAEIKHILTEHGAELAAEGSAAWAFSRNAGVWEPTMTLPLSDEDGEKLSALVDALEGNDEVQEVFTNAA
jgi:YebC/PmpR family DNA-binding regulatory protein